MLQPAKRYVQSEKGKGAYGELEAAIIAYKKSGKTFLRLMGADVPLWGNVNLSMNRCLAQVAEEGWDCYNWHTDWLSEYAIAVSNFEKRFRNVEFLPSNIIPIPGSASGYQLLFNAALEPGDEIVAIEPAHCVGAPCAFLWYLGAKLIQVPSGELNDWEPDLDKLRSSITKRTKFIMMDYPNNPTGAIYSDKARREIVNIAGENDIPIFSDEIYGTIVFDGNEAPSMASVAGDVPVIALSSFSKFFAHPGWRIGYMEFHDPSQKMTALSDVCKKLATSYGHTSTSIPLPILVAATRTLREFTAALKDRTARPQVVRGAVAEAKEMLQDLQLRRDYTFKRLSNMKGVSVVNAKATMYMFPRIHGIGKTWKNVEEFMVNLSREEGLSFDFGRFGNTGAQHFRTMLLPDMPTLTEVYDRLERFLKRHGS